MKFIERFVNQFTIFNSQNIYFDFIENLEFSIDFEKYTHLFFFRHFDEFCFVSKNRKIFHYLSKRVRDKKIVNDYIV